MRRGLLLSVTLLIVVGTLAGCTTFYERWRGLQKGMTKDQVLLHMEEDPSVMKLDANGSGEIIWRMERPQPAIATFKGGLLVKTERYKIE